jgi:tRNA (adenine57-N1/adenine58-N1)-methyltransferase
VAGGILLSYLPSIIQVAQLREALDHSGFGMVETVEVLQRSWHVEGLSVRPDHRMVAHTGFLTAGRLLRVADADEPVSPHVLSE